MISSVDEYRTKLEEIFDSEGERVLVIRDKFAGVRLSVVSERFAALSNADRRKIILDVVPDEDIASLSLTTNSELAAEAERSSNEDAVRELPLWADSLADGGATPELRVNLASSQQEQLEPPIITTFYSLRGGVGRSTALTHTAFNLANQGLAVLCIDMDLEAPGLASLFGVEAEAAARDGVVEILSGIDIEGEAPSNLADAFIRVPTANANDRLELLHAGILSPAYARDLSLIDPESWYREELNPLRVLVQGIRDLEETVRPDVVLIDSRTGLSPIAAPLLFDLADMAVIAFLPHPQARAGTQLLTRALLGARSARVGIDGSRFTPEPRFVVSPVAPSEENYARAERRAIEWISEWLAPARDAEGGKPFDDLEEIIQVIGYNEEVAASDSVRNSRSHEAYNPIAQWIAGIVASSGSVKDDAALGVGGPSKIEVLDSLSFTGQTADGQSAEDLQDIFVSTESVAAALHPGTRLVLGRKGTGKTLLFRQMLFDSSIAKVAVTLPHAEELGPLGLDLNRYRSINETLRGASLGWDVAWSAILLLSLLRSEPSLRPSEMPQLKAEGGGAYRGSALIADFRTLLSIDDCEVLFEDWLNEIDERLQDPLHLIFDGLDTGFGNERELRNEAVTGLMLLLNGAARRFKNLKFKVFLREDIFRAVDFPNKSHLRAEASVLAWNDQYDYLRLIIRQAWRSEDFRRFVVTMLQTGQRTASFTGRFSFETPIEYWPDEIVLEVWQVLVGERMSGGKTAFTNNWVWSRLADANEDHAPRHLVGLFERALTIEKSLEPGTPYSRALIRPRALADALDWVSEGALVAVEEEFPELGKLLGELRSIGKTPFEEAPAGEMDLAKEVGLLARWTDGRYRVPEIYRRALSMTRQGQQ